MNEIITMLTEIRPENDFSNSSNYIEDDLLDSFDVVTLVDMIEKKYNIKIDALDILPENFVNTESIIHLIKKSGGIL